MSIPGTLIPLFNSGAGAGPGGPRSLRFNSIDSANLTKGFGAPTTQSTFTLSMWVKRAVLATSQFLFGAANNAYGFGFSGDALRLRLDGTNVLTTTAVFRDPSAWYHIVWRQSGTSHTLYVNNVSVGTVTATNDLINGNGVVHQIGAANATNYFNGYLTDIHFIDGQALTPSSFGETDATTGVWNPKAYTGTYGNNGFHLDFANNASTTTIGYDAAGSNNWTPNNFSVTAGSGNDALLDYITNGTQTDTGLGGEVVGNYCCWNPLVLRSGHPATLSNGNLDVSLPNTGVYKAAYGSIGISSGKWYWEITASSVSDLSIGVSNSTPIQTDISNYHRTYKEDGRKNSSGSLSSYGATFASGDVIGVGLDLDAGTLVFYKNGSSQGTAFTDLVSALPSGGWIPYVFGDGGSSLSANFGQRAFAYTAPSGYKALCTANLPEPTILKGNTTMDVKLYTGTGSSQTISGFGFSPDLVWTKGRSIAELHLINDSVRGVPNNLYTNLTNAEDSTNYLSALTSDGFTITNQPINNNNSSTYVAWAWDAGSSTVTNTSGSIISSVRANATAGFSIVTYTGNGVTSTVGHGLGAKPGLIILKTRSVLNRDWYGYHSALGATKGISINSNGPAGTGGYFWNNTEPTSTVFTADASYSNSNANGQSYVAYCFAPVVGYSAAFTYTGNGDSSGPFVYLGFRPALVICKRTDSTGDWFIFDNRRPGYNAIGGELYPNSSSAESTTNRLDFLSNGFKQRDAGAGQNASGGTYVGFAWAENPFSYARAR